MAFLLTSANVQVLAELPDIFTIQFSRHTQLGEEVSAIPICHLLTKFFYHVSQGRMKSNFLGLDRDFLKMNKKALAKFINFFF